MNSELFDILISIVKCKCNCYSRKEIIKSTESNTEKVYVVKRGIIKISYTTEQGEEIIFMLLTMGQTFGASLVFSNIHPKYIYESIKEKTILYEFDVNTIRKTIEKNKELYATLLLMLQEEYSELENRIKNLCNKSAEQRVVNVMFEFKDRFHLYTDSEENVMINSPLNQEEISNYTRVTRVTINKIFNKLKKKCLIDYQKEIIILKKDFFKHYKNNP